MMIATRTRRTCSGGHGGRAVRRRGVAMFLVLMALGVGTVLAGVALSAREPGPMIGLNARDAAAATWSAHSAAGLAEAILETNLDWVPKAAADGTLIQDLPLSGGSVTVTLVNGAGLPPTENDRELLMTVTARVGEMVHSIQKRVSLVLPVPIDTAIDLSLREFAVYADEGLEIDDGAYIGVSPLSTEHGSLMETMIGTNALTAGRVRIDTSELPGVKLVLSSTAHASLDTHTDSSQFTGGQRLQLPIPAVAEALPSDLAALLPAPTLATSISAQTRTLSPGSYDSIRIMNNSVVTLGVPGMTTTYRFTAMDVRTGSTVIFAGNVRIYATQACTFQSNAAIEPASPDAALTMYLNNNLTIDNATIGLPRAIAANNSRSPGALTSYHDPARIRIFANHVSTGGQPSPIYRLNTRSIVCGTIHAPQATAGIEGSAALIGCISTRSIRVHNGSTIWYEPRLDTRAGFCAVNGPMYIEGEPLPEVVATLQSFDSAQGAQVLRQQLVDVVNAKWGGAVNPLTALKVVITGDPVEPATVRTNESDGTIEVVVKGALTGVNETVEGVDQVLDDALGGLLGGSKTEPEPEPEPEPILVRSGQRAETQPIASHAQEFEDQ